MNVLTAVLPGESSAMSCRLSAKTSAAFPSPQPNEIDLKRIERALENRKRYRYVTPQVRPVENGYLITSPCCSRNIDPSGGEIDIARLEFLEESQHWRLFQKDHAEGQWVFYADYPALAPILSVLRDDPERRFWQ